MAETTETSNTDAKEGDPPKTTSSTAAKPPKDSGTTTTTTTTKKVEQKDSGASLAAFLKASGYKAEDVLDQNDRRRVFVTSNGGKYQLTKAGRVRRLEGPVFPNEVQESGE